MSDVLHPQFPLYVVSKGRSEYLTTPKALSAMGVKHYIVVEPSQVDEYQKAVTRHDLISTVLEMDLNYKLSYELCDDFGQDKSTGPGPARNFAWEHSKAAGHSWHWVMDDNIKGFFRLNKNLKVPCNTPSYWRAMEDFVTRYTNVAMAGPNYFFFAPRKTKQPPFVTNTRIYSCNLIRNNQPFRWRGRYNEDTILSLDMLKAGFCTIQFNAFLQDKLGTQVQKGGNTEAFYHAEGKVADGQKYADTGTVAKSQMMVKVHPDISKVVYKFGRVHHHVDYTGFKAQKLIRIGGLNIDSADNNYGMNLIKGIKK